MSIIVQGTVLLGAIMFIAISAGMNALFLSSFGRSGVETGLLAAISIAADVIKAVLPLVLLRACMLRMWGQAALSGLMLAVVVSMSLASGLGFAAMARSGSAVALKGAEAALELRLAELADIDRRLALLPAASRARALVDADLATAHLDRSWALSKSCTEMTSAATRTHCARVITLRAELATTTLRDDLEQQRRAIRETIVDLRAKGAGREADPQASVLADLLGTDSRRARAILTGGVAVVLELGSLVLILLAAGPVLRGETGSGKPAETPPVPISVPASADRTHWHRQRSGAPLSFDREASP